MKKHKLDLDLALPSDAAACDACIERMVVALGATRGIARVHVDREDAARPTNRLIARPAQGHPASGQRHAKTPPVAQP